MDTEQLYKDIKARTHGEIYIGVVGPVRTGKSTFIKRFMDVMVLPRMEDEHMKEQTRDELPQSAAGKTIMTTEPKFVPKDAAVIHLNRDVEVKVRLIDCVGYLVKGASGYEEAGHERMVKTPWYQEEIPFTKAAVTGTQKVIREHATIGIVVTTDGTITDIPSDNYEDAEARTIRELQSIRKPFVVLVNSKKPHGQEAKEKVKKLEDTYQIRAMTVNCEQIKEEDIYQILEAVLYEFPVSEVQFYIPKWVEMLPVTHKIKQDLLEHIQEILGNLEEIKDAVSLNGRPDSSYIKDWYVEQIQMDTGCVIIRIHMY
ncbi:MAG: stage IV sporulation protein A, partial [Dorea sp.]|nr:stage IV sporulation protein A [Dorea sp.]